MNERDIYSGINSYEGSIADDGTIYDERHNKLGRIEGGIVYDTGGVRRGVVENGKVWDVSRNFIGDVRGDHLVGPSGQYDGYSRGDSLASGDGGEYGALRMLKRQSDMYPREVFEEEDECEHEDTACEDSYEENESYDEELVEEVVPIRKSVTPTLKRKIFKPRPLTRNQKTNSSYVPPDEDFSTGKKNEYRINDMIYVDISGHGFFWTQVLAFFAGLDGKGIITGWDKMHGAWDQMKRDEAARRGW